MTSLSNKIALITGASGDIGRACAIKSRYNLSAVGSIINAFQYFYAKINKPLFEVDL